MCENLKFFQLNIYFADKHIIELEIKDTFTRFTNDVIATSAFGIKVDSLKERDNQFYLMGKEATTFTTSRFIKMMIAMINPKILRVRK